MSNEAETMKKKSKRTLTPKLRFPEFRDEPGWKSESLGRLFANRQEKGFSELPLLSVTDERGIIPQEETNRRDNSNSDKSRYLRVVPGDIAYNTMRMWEGRSAYVDREGLVSPAYTVCQPQNKIHGKFFSYYFKTSSLIEQFRRYSQGLVKDTLSLKYNGFACISVPSPQFAEQQKIADCLSSLDELIADEGRKLEALKAHKKGLMQQLFPQPGETQPRLRFPEFRDSEGWQTPQLSDLYGFKRTNTLSRDKLNYEAGTIRNIHYGDIHTKFKPLFRVEHEDVPFINPEVSVNAFKEEDYCEEGDIVLADASEDLNDVGKAIEIISLDGQRIVAGTHTILATRHGCMPMVGFGGHLFQSAAVRAGIQRESQGAKVYGISANRISAIALPLPPTNQEQQKIADCLTALDTRITAQAAKIDVLKQHKRGLMQQLFPSPEEQ